METDNWSRLLVSLRVDEEFPLTPATTTRTSGTGGSTTAYYTRVPDKHLSPDLTPLHTEISDSLAGILVANAEAKIKLMQDTHKDHPPDQLVSTERPIPTEVMTKTGVCEWYLTRARTWCRIAAALGLHNGNWDWSMLRYTTDIMPQYALADGEIMVLNDTAFNYLAQEFPLSANDEMRSVWKALRERTVQNTIISWEFKSPFAGSEEVMESIVRIIRLGSFQWEFCEKKNCKEHTQYSPQVGHDAPNPLAGPLSNDLPEDDDESVPARKRRRLITDKEEEETRGPDIPDDSHGSDCQDPLEKEARDIIQQVWAQACIKDLTYFVIHSGNFELICIRHRGSRTLYCSDLVERCKNKYPYGLLQVGVYLAAIDDAVKRCHEADTGGGGGGTGDNSSASGDRHGGPGPSGGGAGSAPLSGLEDEAIRIDNAIKGSAKAFVRLKYSVYDSVCPWVFHRVDLLLQPPGCPESRHAKKSISVTLTSEISRSKGIIVHGGVIHAVSTESGTVSRPIIMKIGFNRDISLIKDEYDIYKHLKQNGVPTPKVHGLFQDRDPDGATSTAILMDHAGTRIDQVPGGLSETQRTFFCGLLQQIHDAGVLHDGIATRNLLVSDAGEPVIIDFGNSIVVSGKKRKAFKDEMKLLRHVLGKHASEKGPHS